MSIALNCEFVNRAATTKEYVPGTEDTPAHFVFSDGIGRNGIDNSSVGCIIYLTPGKSDKIYDTCSADSPARLVSIMIFSYDF